MDVYLKNSFI